MKEFSITNAEKFRRIDPVILLCVLGMNIMSIVTLTAASDAYGTWYVRMQILASALGIAMMFMITFIDYDTVCQKLKYVFFAASILLIVWVKFFGEGSNGNANWITFGDSGISVQPTEFVKITFMITFALHLNKLKHRINHPWSIVQLALHAGLIIGMVLWQGDLGMALVYMGIMVFMVFASGVSLWYFAGVIGAAVMASPLIWKFLSTNQQNRILFGFNPDLDPQGVGWDAIRSRNCIISGGFRGAGFDDGTRYKSFFAGQSDFIYAVLAEKFGFIGTFLYITLMVILVLRILWIAGRTRKAYASYICVGIAGMLIVQSAENIGMCLAMLPVVGITLPFMSYGASSMLSMYICIGIVQSICAHNKKYYFEREKR
ncbi:MAG: rod shape-determining protein RodA [Clostridia bacterium]|nr:rod shape-determining protein RodA [Clostridia bacterium]